MPSFLQGLKDRQRLVLATGLVAVTLCANALIGINLTAMEKHRERQHLQLTEKIAQVSEGFLINHEHHYFYDTVRLIHEMYYVRYVALSLDREIVARVGELTPREQRGLNLRPGGQGRHSWEGPENLFWVSVPVEYQNGGWASIVAAYSLADMRAAQHLIALSSGVSMGLLLVLVFFLVKLQLAEKMKATMLSAISHDAMHNLQPMFTQISTFVEQDQGNYSKVSILRVMRNLKMNLLGVKRVLENLRFNDQLSRGNLKVMRAPTDLDESIRFVLESYTRMALDKQIRLIYLPAEQTCSLLVDPVLLGSVLMNVLDNALKYSPPQTEVKFCTTCHGAWVQLEVTDQGVGIPENAWERVFKPYVRLVDENDHEKGSGLGLANARRVARLHGGDLTILASRPGQGTTFCLKLPKA